MSVRNSRAGKAARRAARDGAGAARAQARDPATVALELVKAVLDEIAQEAPGATPGDLPSAARALLPDGTSAAYVRRVLLYLAGLAASSAISEAKLAGITPGEYVDDLIRRRPNGGRDGG